MLHLLNILRIICAPWIPPPWLARWLGHIFAWPFLPEHRFDSIKTLISVIPATLLSLWALINQRRQTVTRLKVRVMPMYQDTVKGELIVSRWTGVEVRNMSNFPIYIRSVGYMLDGHLYGFGPPLNHRERSISWPYELAAHRMCGFFLQEHKDHGRRFILGIKSILKNRFIWEAGTAYAVTETDERFFSKPMPRGALRELRKRIPPAWHGRDE